jgi:ABC-2 type transport system permease protein
VKIWAVMVRDLLRILRNPAALLSAVILPILYLLILGNALQGPLKGLRLGVIRLDQGPAARELLGALQAVQNGPRTFRVVSYDDPEEAKAALRQGELSGLLVIPPDFSRQAARGLAAPVGLQVDNVDGVAAQTLQVTVQAAVLSLRGAGLPATRSPLVRFERALGQPELRVAELYPKVDYDTSLIPGVVVLSIFMGSMLTGAFNLVMDRFLGVHESYLSTPLTRLDITLGVLLSGTIVTLGSSGLVLVFGFLITGTVVHGGILGWLALVGVVVLTALGLLAMMMVLLARAGHPRITGVLGGFLNVILFFPSGALYPLASFPPWLRAFARVDPETHAVAALKAILFRGGDLSAAATHVGFLAAFAAAMLGLSMVTMKRTL